MAQTIQMRRGTAANWTTANPILAAGEHGIEIDTHKWKVGDGTLNWATLPYAFTPADPPLVTSLPGSPVDGQECYYLADATNGVVWHLKYRAASASTHKWEFVGGSPWVGTVPGTQTTTSTTPVDLATVGPAFTAPIAGDYAVRFGANAYNSSAIASSTMTVSAPSGSHPCWIAGPGASVGASGETSWMWTLASGDQLQSKYNGSSGTSSFVDRFLHVTPVRVG
jgi:hypothetical protein